MFYLSDFYIRVIPPSKNELRNGSLSSIFLEGMESNCSFYFKYFIKFTSKIIRTQKFFLDRLSIRTLTFFRCKAIQLRNNLSLLCHVWAPGAFFEFTRDVPCLPALGWDSISHLHQSLTVAPPTRLMFNSVLRTFTILLLSSSYSIRDHILSVSWPIFSS